MCRKKLRSSFEREPRIHRPQPETGAADGHALAHAGTLLGFAVVIVLLVGGREVLMHRDASTVGSFVAFNTYMMQLTWPIIALGWVINIFQRGTASLARINEIMSEQPEIQDGAGEPRGDASSARAKSNFAISISATTAKPVLHNLNLRIPAGSSLAIVGPTGSGKSTLVYLIPRIYDAASGHGSHRWPPYPRISARLAAAQHRLRSSGNVSLQRHAFAKTSPSAWSTATDRDPHRRRSRQHRRRHRELSRGLQYPGRRARHHSLGRTKAAHRHRSRTDSQSQILILDDALSSVDTQTEDNILNHLRDVMQGRTTIFISHRVSTVRNADRIAVLHGGEIVEFGTHDELLALNGYYTDLYNKQLLEEELAEV